MENFALKDRFAKHLHAEIVEVVNGRAKAKLKIREDYLNGLDTAHGGVIFSLVDYTFALAANNQEETGFAINSSINFIKSAALGDEIFADVKEISRSRRLGMYQGFVSNQNGDILAQFQAMAYLKKKEE
ncbi:MAG: hotdog fold thioesterase [Candidatus Omnitrophica bacterium]|nr:hotdog fold thioesterase [Candidatus Omnitrophota bacterium]